MDILRLIGFFFGANFLCGISLAHISVLQVPKEMIGHGTQYRFQYFIRDEHGDYKTQEEAGGGGKARGSYAVEEPNGDMRIVQYTADIGGEFKAHIKVNHADESPASIDEIKIGADEIRKLIESNRKNIRKENSQRDVEEDQLLSKSYSLGPTKKISDIIMEQAAAIREILSKEIEKEKLKTGTVEYKIEEKSDSRISVSEKNTEREKPVSDNVEVILIPKKADISSIQNSDMNLNESNRKGKGRKIDEKNLQSPVVRVALSPRKVEDSEKRKDNEEANVEMQSEILGEGPVKNYNFKNRLLFYKPSEKKPNQNFPQIVSKDDEENSKITYNNDKRKEEKEDEDEEEKDDEGDDEDLDVIEA